MTEPSGSGSSMAPDPEISTGTSDASTPVHAFDCAVCHRSGDCNGGADNCDPTDFASHVHYDCMESF